MKTQTEIVDEILKMPKPQFSLAREGVIMTAIALLEAQLEEAKWIESAIRKEKPCFGYNLVEETEHNLNRLRGENNV